MLLVSTKIKQMYITMYKMVNSAVETFNNVITRSSKLNFHFVIEAMFLSPIHSIK